VTILLILQQLCLMLITVCREQGQALGVQQSGLYLYQLLPRLL